MDNIAQKNEIVDDNIDCIVHYYNTPELKNYDVSFHWWQDESTSMHSHDFYEFFIITDNGTLHEINGRREKLARGTLYMIRPKDKHKFIHDDGLSCVHINFCVTQPHMRKICDAMKISLDSLCASEYLRTALSSEELSFFVRRARMLNLMMRENPKQANTLICELIAQAVTVIGNSAVGTTAGYPPWFVELLEKIHSPENLAINSKDVYAMGGFSPPVMINYFKKYTGKTVNAYLRDCKCENACRLLQSTHLSTLEISNALGYDSLSHFNRIFKQYSGVSPAVYRHKAGV